MQEHSVSLLWTQSGTRRSKKNLHRKDGEPEVVLTWNPLGRDARFLEPFAAALDRYLSDCVTAGEMPRVWLAHAAALEVIELLGHRYRTNRNVGSELQRMGAQCRLLAEETTFAGQQIVAIAGSLLAGHVVTGQSPSEDLHLGALLAWINPPAGIAVVDAAAQAALEPAAAMLARAADDWVEQLRERVARGRLSEARARTEAEAIIREEALREWALLVRARRVFWNLGLAQGPELTRLVAESLGRVAWQIDRNYGSPARPRFLVARVSHSVPNSASAASGVSTRTMVATRSRTSRSSVTSALLCWRAVATYTASAPRSA